MRLIDADALLKALKTLSFPIELDSNVMTIFTHDVVNAITNAPTVQREGWQPIKTAPKGEAVLVAGGDCDYPCTANYSGHPDECWMVDGQMDVYAEIGWPEYWMPLSALPSIPAAPTLNEKG